MLGQVAGAFKTELPQQKKAVVARLQEVLENGDRGLLPITINALSGLNGEEKSLAIKRVEDRVTKQRFQELTEAAE